MAKECWNRAHGGRMGVAKTNCIIVANKITKRYY